MDACGVPSVLAKDARFQALKEEYKDKKYSDDSLAQALQLCREYHGYEDDWFPVEPTQKAVFTRFINNELEKMKVSKTKSTLGEDSLYNLYSTLYNTFTPEKLEDRIDMLAGQFRYEVDKLQKNDTENRTRQEIIASQADENRNGYTVIMSRIFDAYEKQFGSVEEIMKRFDDRYPNATEAQRERARKNAEYRVKEFKIILENKQRLAALAATKIGEEEGFVVTVKNFEVEFDPFNEENELSQDSETPDNENKTDKEEGSKGERFADFRTLKLMNSLGPRAKRLLSSIPKLDSNGKPIRDDLGVMRYIGARQAAVVLKRVLVNSSPETMMSDLHAAADFYPWLKGLINELERDTDLQTTIYCSGKSAETIYLYDNLEDGQYQTHIANSRSAGNVLAREAGTNLRGFVLQEDTSIYTGYGALKSLDAIRAIRKKFTELKDLIQSDGGTRFIKMVDKDKPTSTKRINEIIEAGKAEGKDYSYLLLAPEDAMSAFLAQHPDLTEQIAGLLRGMGFSVSASDIENVAKQTMNTKSFAFITNFVTARTSNQGRNKLYQLVEWMDGVYGRAEQIYNNNLTPTGAYLFNTSNAFNRINRCLALAKYDEVEARVVNEGKSLSTYNHVNLLHQVFDMLANKSGKTEERYLEDIENEYLQYEGMALGFGPRREVHGWLKSLIDNENNIREKFRVYDMAGFNHVEYADLTRQQKLTNGLIQYITAGQKLLQGENRFAAYEVPIQADYSTAYNFVTAPKFSEEAIVELLTNEVLMELERIDSIQKRQNDDSRAKLRVYEEQGLKFQVFPAFNNNGFLEGYKAQGDAQSAKEFVRQQVRAQLKEVVGQDIATIEDSQILTNKFLKKVKGSKTYNFYTKDGLVSSLSQESQNALRDYFINTYYARLQIVKLTTGGLNQFNGLIDFEKRNMLSHATRSSIYTRATWKGKPVGKETQNVVYIDDDKSASAFLEDIKEMLNALKEEGLISDEQFKSMLSSYSGITTTDGQGLRTLDSYRTVMIMSDQWDDKHENAYRHIKEGHPTREDINVFMQNIKPVLTGYEHIPAANGDSQKPVKLTVLHKYSEMVLLPMELAKYCLQSRTVPMRALDRAYKQLGSKDIDMFLFTSGVKVGAHSSLQPFAKDKDGNRLINSESEIADYITERINANPFTIHTLPFKYYGMAAATPVHVANDRIAWAAQAEKVAWANVEDKDKLTVRGEQMKSSDARELYFSIKTANIIETYKQLRELFTDADELEKTFKEELASKSYSSRELMFALSRLKDGEFALPLFSPNVEHQVQELLSSIIKKRMTKSKVKGANILQATGLGMDIEASAFDESRFPESEKLSVVFEGTGKNKRIKYVEVYMPIHDSRLRQFADKNGNIDSKRLQKLIDNGTIPESLLEFIAYRTPSDAEHSVIPCRIKGFVANTNGATIMMPKEIMVMTGHDYDGDKMRCHFKDFRVVNRSGEEMELSEADIMRMMLGQKKVGAPDEMLKCEVYDYDYSKSSLENSLKSRNNARVELMFAELTSPAGSKRMLIPGGCDETKIYAKTFSLLRAAKDTEARKRIVEKLVEQGMDTKSAHIAANNPINLYNVLTKKNDKNLTDILRAVSSLETPYTVTHSADAFDYIMGGAQMIGVYATYNSAMQMLQRVNITYIPQKTKKGKDYDVRFFGHSIGKQFQIRNHKGELASLGLARLLNAAVDNNKDPLLGYLNQTPELAEMTFMLFSSGLTEEEVHLIINQPVVVELAKRLKSRESKGFAKDARKLLNELASVSPKDLAEKYTENSWKALEYVSKMHTGDYVHDIPVEYNELAHSEDADQLERQLAILRTLIHLAPAASQLTTFVRQTRPESESGAIGSSIADITAKVIELNKFRQEILNPSPTNPVHFSGMAAILQPRKISWMQDTDTIEDILGSQLPEVVALNSLMIDSSLEMFQPYFPQAKAAWVDVIREISDGYQYMTTQEGVTKKVANEMILWRLLSDKKFISGNPQEEQKRVIVDVPANLKSLKQRIAYAEKNSGTDRAAEQLIGNAFLSKLTFSAPETSEDRPRIQFSLNGQAVEGSADLIRASWGQMLKSSDKSIRDLAVDLFKYNLYTNGLAYGMYEFAHFAPYSVLASVPEYIPALRRIMNVKWSDDVDRENFIHQYYMNHWGDKKFLNAYNANDLKFSVDSDKNVHIIGAKDENVLPVIRESRYIIIVSGTDENRSEDLYRVESVSSEEIVLQKAQKLGYRNRNQQVILQYNPTVDYHLVQPVVAGNESAWGQLDVIDPYAESNINSGTPMESAPIGNNTMLGASFFGLSAVAEDIDKIQEKAETAVEKNDTVIEHIPAPTIEDAPIGGLGAGFFGLDSTDGIDLSGAVARSGSDEGQMLNIVRRDENGNIVSENVPATPNNISLARKQKVFVELNKRLREILRDKGVAIGAITDAEARMSIGGVADFDTATVTAEGLLELIRLANGYEGEQALPEEFAHVALEMLGHDNPLVQRLLTALNNNDEAMQEAFGDSYQEYINRYGEENKDKLVLEAAGKLVAKELFRQQEIESSPVRRLIHRIVEAIKEFFRKFRISEVQNAIFDANEIASKVAREMLGGKILDQMDVQNIGTSGQFLKVQKDLSGKTDILSKLLKTENKRLAIFKKRRGYAKNNAASTAMEATESQIAKLEAAIENYKTEDAIVSYMHDSLEFLAATEKSLDDTINANRPANAVCRKLNVVRDTLYSFSTALNDISDAIIHGEIEDTANIRKSVEALSSVLNLFYQKYNKYAQLYFEEMLSSVYGEKGKTVTIGKDKGRVITIKEMASKADRDISLASRWFHSLADCGDYVLKAIDDIVRNAKTRARRRATDVRPRIENALNELIKATGSRDQSFMLETKMGEDGKLHRTGKYISGDALKNLTPAQRKFYDEMMAIKKDADKCIPETLVEDNKIVMMRKYTMDRYKDAEGAKGKALEAWEGLKGRVMDYSDSADDYEYYEVAKDFEGNRVDMLPVKFVLKGKHETYDDMTDDVATSIMAYAGMAYEYNELSGVVNILENAKYMASQRDVVQHTGNRTQRETVETEDTIFREPFTRKQASSRMQEALDDFYQMHVYGHIRANEGTFGNTRISKRKVVDTLNAITSYSQMAINIPQRIANVMTGMTQIVIESIGKGAFKTSDILWGSKIYVKESGDRLAETGKTDYDNKLSLWAEYFDVHQDNGRYDAKYKKGRMSRIFNSSLLYAGLQMGEDYLSMTTSLALARNFKMKDANGKECTLWDAYEVKYKNPAEKSGAYLSLKEGYTKADGSPLTFADEQAFAKKVAGMNFELQGIYNLDDRSPVQQYAFGALIIMYRKWIAPALKRRYAGVHYNALKGEDEEGYHRTMFRLMGDIIKDTKNQVTEEEGAKALLNIIADMKALRTSIQMNWGKMNDYEKSNVHRSLAELAIVAGLYITCSLFGKIPPYDYPDDERGAVLKWWDQTVMSQMLRLRTEIGSQAPTPMLVGEALRILRSPFAAIEPLQNTINAFQLLLPWNYTTEIKSGRYRGHSKAYKYFRELPIISMAKKVDNFLDPGPMIQFYKNDVAL